MMALLLCCSAARLPNGSVLPCPAGADFLTVLGAHEGEGLLVEHDAAVSD